MMLATDHRGETRHPSPGASALCPHCGANVKAKCGQLVTWHWAHCAVADCDSWAEPDSAWHQTWQARFPDPMREVTIGSHRADVVATDGLVVELQHSAISTKEIRERERYYGRMIWIFDTREQVEEGRLLLRKPRPDDYRTFRWKHPRKSLVACRAPVLLDVGGGELLLLGRLYPKAPCGGWGRVLDVEEVRHRILHGSWPEKSPSRRAA